MSTKAPARKDEALLKEIRERWQHAADAWREIREEGSTDMKYVAGDPWPAAERKARENAGRPCLSLDELGQYVNQVINDVRENSRAIKVTPIGDGANDETARLRQDLIRQIEYRSNAQMAYTTMFENTVQRSFGFLRIKAQYVDDRGFDQELLIEPLPNPDDVTPDPDSVRTDGSDWRYVFIRESRSHDEFKREFPHAEVQNFDAELIAEVGHSWLTESKVYLAEYWVKQVRKRELLLLKNQREPVFADEIAKIPTDKGAIIRRREVDEVQVCQYLTNGVEILKKTEWPGKYLPIVPCYGKVIYVDEGAGSKRKILSMVRLARDPYMLYCFYRTNEAEVVGMSPKTPFIGYTGQFRDHEDKWQTVNQQPLAYLEANPTTEATGQNLLPLPQRQPYEPPIAALEIGAEAARRAIQAAMGQSPLPTAAQRRNEKSGVALKQMEDSAQKGSYHFIDHYDESIARTGVILDDLIPHYYDTPRDVTVRRPDDTAEQVRINDQAPQGQPQQPGATPPVNATVGRHDVTISTGPSFDSEREAASEFADLLVQNPQVFPLIAPLVIKLKNLGALGDEMADVLTAMAPPQVQAILSKGKNNPAMDLVKLQQDLSKAMEQNQLLTQELQAKTQAIQTDQVKAQQQFAIEQLRQENENLRAAAEHDKELALAELKATLDLLKTRATLEQQQTLAMVDTAVAQQDAAVAAAGQAEERQMRSDEAEADRQFERESADASRAHEANEAERDRAEARRAQQSEATE